jgi:hypothetical protein
VLSKYRFLSGDELDPILVTEEYSATAVDGKNYKTKFYNLDAVIAVGYRVNSKKATQFRIWATNTLKEYIIKGFVICSRQANRRDFAKAIFQNFKQVSLI